MSKNEKLIVKTEDTVTLLPVKQFTIDMEKVIACGDINAKVNSIFSIFAEMKITIQEYAMTDELRKYTKEI